MRRYSLKQLRAAVRGGVPQGSILRRWWLEVGPGGAQLRIEYDEAMGTGPRVVATVAL